MGPERRIRLTEGDSMESGLRCPACGTYTAISDIIATGRCRNGGSSGSCDVTLHVDVVVER
ncbi:hypothetical protein GL213_00185 [Halogeometricum borinquense]|uniref:Uncharacterized protein n=2 Tax=Halogeometricum borinquense TaxID=60847 RepID=L9UQ00_HALBP|nr:hypothetical protein [Halogeometricum borinquense]ELY26980.1 hypothetical protein C499_10609 [Halogeometricum borinquense DSM 11551]QIB72945.1 hypothetical protein G3I44_00765 [Halogeometricum borinquense]QIQ75096.1 hypothetical protein GL213_00185 [Halogeometricum borinquense]RYJ15157.1 hypothetical protein ELS19_15185 [Halogeometricum borinquense]